MSDWQVAERVAGTDYTVRWRDRDAAVDVEGFIATAWRDETWADPMYLLKDWKESGDLTRELDEAERQFHGTAVILCGTWTIGQLHSCTRRTIEELGQAMAWAWDTAMAWAWDTAMTMMGRDPEDPDMPLPDTSRPGEP